MFFDIVTCGISFTMDGFFLEFFLFHILCSILHYPSSGVTPFFIFFCLKEPRKFMKFRFLIPHDKRLIL